MISLFGLELFSSRRSFSVQRFDSLLSFEIKIESDVNTFLPQYMIPFCSRASKNDKQKYKVCRRAWHDSRQQTGGKKISDAGPDVDT